MKTYEVHEFFCKGILAQRPLNRMIRSRFAKPNRRGGIIVFPERIKEKNIDTSFIDGRFRIDYLLSEKYVARDGTCFSDYSPCVDIRDYKSGDMMTAALKYARNYPGNTVLLKDIDDGRLYSIRYLKGKAVDQIPATRLKEEYAGENELLAA